MDNTYQMTHQHKRRWMKQMLFICIRMLSFEITLLQDIPTIFYFWWYGWTLQKRHTCVQVFLFSCKMHDIGTQGNEISLDIYDRSNINWHIEWIYILGNNQGKFARFFWFYCKVERDMRKQKIHYIVSIYVAQHWKLL